MEFSTYFSFHEKNKFIKNSIFINTNEELDVLMNNTLSDSFYSNFKWRGMNNANQKLTNSCQRYFHKVLRNESIDLYHDFIYNLINYVHDWNNGTIQRYLESQNITNDPVATMTLMQHFGFPTPLLDFSKNPLIALFFATKFSEFTDTEDDINNYCSLYSLNTDIQDLRDFNKQYHISDHNVYLDKYSPLRNTKLLVISEEDPEFKIGTSLNLINQEGVFVYSNDPELSMEEIFVKSNYLNEDGSPKLKCWHIHKSLNRKIRTLLDRNYQFNDDFVFPDLYKMFWNFQQG